MGVHGPSEIPWDHSHVWGSIIAIWLGMTSAGMNAIAFLISGIFYPQPRWPSYIFSAMTWAQESMLLKPFLISHWPKWVTRLKSKLRRKGNIFHLLTGAAVCHVALVWMQGRVKKKSYRCNKSICKGGIQQLKRSLKSILSWPGTSELLINHHYAYGVGQH